MPAPEDQELDEVAAELLILARTEQDPDDKAKWYKLYMDAKALKAKDAKKKRGGGFDLG